MTSSFCCCSPCTFSAADRAEHVLEPRAPHLRGDHLGGDRQRREDPRERAGRLGVVGLLLQDVGLQRDELAGAVTGS